MKEKSSKIMGFKTEPGDQTEKKTYGAEVLVTRLGQINIVHLDRPSQETIHRRIEEVLREEIRDETFEDDCPLCQEMKKHPYDVIYDGTET